MAGSWTAQDAAGVLRTPTADDDKYSRGVLGVRTGSEAYPGAAVLGVEAAWRTGVGMVRYLGSPSPTRLVLHRRPETVTIGGRVQAWLIGSGTDAAHRSDVGTEVLRDILSGSLPVVVDAGALDLVVDATAPLIITPHRREHDRLRAQLGLAEHTGADVPRPRRIGRRDRRRPGRDGRAEGGRDDHRVAGRMGEDGRGRNAVACHGRHGRRARGRDRRGRRRALSPHDLGALAATGVWLHARAATSAADDLGAAGGPITAIDVAGRCRVRSPRRWHRADGGHRVAFTAT